METIYDYELKGFAADSKRSLQSFRMRKFERSWKFKALVYAFLPLYMLLNPQKKSISILAALSAPLLTGAIYA